ncbi:MAG: hypothetical protein ACOCQG_03765 [Candidatus Nanoarchaeia archaeon]
MNKKNTQKESIEIERQSRNKKNKIIEKSKPISNCQRNCFLFSKKA